METVIKNVAGDLKIQVTRAGKTDTVYINLEKLLDIVYRMNRGEVDEVRF